MFSLSNMFFQFTCLMSVSFNTLALVCSFPCPLIKYIYIYCLLINDIDQFNNSSLIYRTRVCNLSLNWSCSCLVWARSVLYQSPWTVLEREMGVPCACTLAFIAHLIFTPALELQLISAICHKVLWMRMVDRCQLCLHYNSFVFPSWSGQEVKVTFFNLSVLLHLSSYFSCWVSSWKHLGGTLCQYHCVSLLI